MESLNPTENTNRKMIESVKVIEDFLKGKVIDIASFSKYIYENASFFLSEVPKDYTVVDKNIQFVRMNNRGKQLEAHDILKIKLASKLEDKDERSAFVLNWNCFALLRGKTATDATTEASTYKESLAVILSQPFDSKNAPKEEEIFYSSIVGYPEFLLIALKRFSGKDIVFKRDSLLEVFGVDNAQNEWTPDTVRAFGELLAAQFELFNSWFIKRDKKEDYHFSKESKALENSTNLKQFQSYLYVSREAHFWMLPAFDWLTANPSIDLTAFLDELKRIDNDYATKRPSTLTYGDGNLRYWLYRLDYYLWERREECFAESARSKEIASRYLFRENRSVEHICPQNRQENSTDPFNGADLLDNFGNLALISSGQNSKLSNSSYGVKQGYIADFINGAKTGTIESLKLLAAFKSNDWNDEICQAHGAKMLSILIDSLPDGHTARESFLQEPNAS